MYAEERLMKVLDHIKELSACTDNTGYFTRYIKGEYRGGRYVRGHYETLPATYRAQQLSVERFITVADCVIDGVKTTFGDETTQRIYRTPEQAARDSRVYKISGLNVTATQIQRYIESQKRRVSEWKLEPLVPAKSKQSAAEQINIGDKFNYAAAQC
jgi:hypothetical protein